MCKVLAFLNSLHTTGHLTWEWTAKIRGYLYPAVFTVLYKALNLFGVDSFVTVVSCCCNDTWVLFY